MAFIVEQGHVSFLDNLNHHLKLGGLPISTMHDHEDSPNYYDIIIACIFKNENNLPQSKFNTGMYIIGIAKDTLPDSNTMGNWTTSICQLHTRAKCVSIALIKLTHIHKVFTTTLWSTVLNRDASWGFLKDYMETSLLCPPQLASQYSQIHEDEDSHSQMGYIMA